MTYTPASLFNTDENFFRHKILISGERKHSNDDIVHNQNAMIRQLLSEKKISRMVSVPGGVGGGRWVTERQRGKDRLPTLRVRLRGQSLKKI